MAPVAAPVATIAPVTVKKEAPKPKAQAAKPKAPVVKPAAPKAPAV